MDTALPSDHPPMRIEFVRSGRQGLDWAGDVLRIGSATRHRLCLSGPGIAADHVELRADARGIWLKVMPGAQRVYVNARPVREYALLRLGDTLSVGGQRMLLRAVDSSGTTGGADAAAFDAPPAVSIRAVAGPCSGRAWSVHEALHLGRDGPIRADESESASLGIGWRDGRLRLTVHPDFRESGALNGAAVGEGAWLQHGDCIGLGGQRFVVDAWALAPSAVDRDDADVAVAETAPREETPAPRGEMWWLLLTAAGLGLLIALVLLFRL